MNVVLVGSFNPSIVQPYWLASKGLVKPEEAEHADVEVISRELVSFRLPESLGIQVTLDRFQIAEASAPSRELLRDLAEGVLRYLPETPLAAMGINHNYHYRVATEDAWHAFGHHVAPKEMWEGVLREPGTRSLILQGVRPDEYAGRVIVQIEPSLRVHPGIFVALNDHFQLDAMDMTTGERAIDVLVNAWEPSVDRAQAITDQVLKVAGAL